MRALNASTVSPATLEVLADIITAIAEDGGEYAAYNIAYTDGVLASWTAAIAAGEDMPAAAAAAARMVAALIVSTRNADKVCVQPGLRTALLALEARGPGGGRDAAARALRRMEYWREVSLDDLAAPGRAPAARDTPAAPARSAAMDSPHVRTSKLLRLLAALPGQPKPGQIALIPPVLAELGKLACSELATVAAAIVGGAGVLDLLASFCFVDPLVDEPAAGPGSSAWRATEALRCRMVGDAAAHTAIVLGLVACEGQRYATALAGHAGVMRALAAAAGVPAAAEVAAGAFAAIARTGGEDAAHQVVCTEGVLAALTAVVAAGEAAPAAAAAAACAVAASIVSRRTARKVCAQPGLREALLSLERAAAARGRGGGHAAASGALHQMELWGDVSLNPGMEVDHDAAYEMAEWAAVGSLVLITGGLLYKVVRTVA